MKIAVPKEFFGEGINAEVKETLEKAIETYKELGAEVEEIALDVAKYSLATYYIIACAEASSNLGIKNQEVKDLGQKLKEELFLVHMYYLQDIMMHITKKLNKSVH